jgi:4'-phosphopantetheinyl transferase
MTAVDAIARNAIRVLAIHGPGPDPRARAAAILAEMSGAPAAAVRVIRRPNHAPSCRIGGKPGPSISFAGCAGWSVLAVGGEGAIGVDVERPRKLSVSFRDLAAQAFHWRERATLDRLQPQSAEAERFFFRCWTRKEAIGKALGVGLVAELGAIDTLGDDAGAWARVALPGLRHGWIADIPFGRGDVIGAVASVGDRPELFLTVEAADR